ncbi:C40 family peptidase [Rothia dentocariosa]|jgi:hypothetical protein|uniref:Hydrolase n=1 Tax=Rothia dentocariosa TaxID=2047 RepID=A0AAE5KMY7_9MICC|nr:C40 family peptidase [Rothia dentocariosa]PAK85202.1 hydrolase [Rothia dentocariosa]PLA18867.1 hydrolase [Rothia dentocariosa]
MAKKIVRNAGIVAVAGAAVIGSNIPANAFAEVPAATDLSYDYSSYEYDYSSYQTPATSYVAPQAEQQTEYVAPAQQTAQVETTSAQAPAPAADKTPAPATNNASRDAIVSAAKAAQGTGYVWGGRSYGAWDCSGFVSYIFAQQGIKLTPYTYTMSTELRATANPQPGDIVFTNGYNHVGIYVGNGQMVSALNPSQGTQLTPVDGNGYMPVDGYYTAF